MKKINNNQFGAAMLALVVGFGSAQASVISHYSFDTDYTDGAGSFDGTLVDTGTLGNSGISTTSGEHKFGGGAMNFSAERDYLSVAERTFSSISGDYSFAFWAKRANTTQEWNMVLGDDSDAADFIALNNANFLRLRGANSDADRQHDFTGLTVDVNWHHYVVIGDANGYGSGTMKLYVDGVAQTDSPSTKSTGFTFNAIGEAYTSGLNGDFFGQIDELWVFDEVIDATTVGHLYNTNTLVAVPEPSAAALLGLGGLSLILRRKK